MTVTRENAATHRSWITMATSIRTWSVQSTSLVAGGYSTASAIFTMARVPSGCGWGMSLAVSALMSVHDKTHSSEVMINRKQGMLYPMATEAAAPVVRGDW